MKNELTSVTVNNQTTTFAYDASGMRVKTIRPNGTIIDTPFPDYEVESPGQPAQTIRITLSIAGQAAAQRVITTGTSTYYYLFTDHLGSLAAMQASDGSLVGGSRAYYHPFGDYRGTPPSQTLTDRGFTGQKSNNQPAADLGLLYYNARYYLPAIAKFASADTIVPDPANPQQFNRYAYTLNNPVKFVDPAGHRTCTAQQAAAGDETCNQNINDNAPGYLGNGYQSVKETAAQVTQAIQNLMEQIEMSNPVYMELVEIAQFTHNITNPVQYCQDNGITYPCNKREQYIPCQYWQPCYEPVFNLHGPDAIVVGGSGSAAGILYATAGGELMGHLKNGNLSGFSYFGQGSGIALGADASGYFGAVWNMNEFSDYEGLTSNLTLDLTLLYGIQINLFWSTGTTPFTGHPWGITLGGSGGGSLGITGSQTNYVCNFGCQ